MRRLDSAIPVGPQALSDVIKLCVRECVSKYRVFDRGFSIKNTFTCRACSAFKESDREDRILF